MQLIFERSREGRSCSILPACDVAKTVLPETMRRANAPRLPMVSEIDLSRHYTELEKHVYGVNDGFYPLGSCTMKYNPQIDEEMAHLPGFSGVHPLQPIDTVQGSLEVLATARNILCEITGMDDMTFQPAAGAHGELTSMLMIKAYHHSKGNTKRDKIIVPDAAHGTNPASAAMAGFTVINIASNKKGCVDLDLLRKAVGPDTAGLMLTNPNTVGIFDENILEITRMILVISRMFSSKIPTVFGLVSMRPAVSGPTALRSRSRSTQPFLLEAILITVKPAIAAEAGLVPWAASGTIILSRLVLPL